ncbi:hypothetical protein ACS0TY_017450 [Phlomoides rotata]
MNHSKAWNVIERTFGLLKKWWTILRSPSFYPINIQNKIILACTLIHNFICNESPNDPLEVNLHSASENPGGDDGLIDAGTADPTRVPLQNRNERGRRGWSLREEEVLSDAMKRIVSEGWKTENGFKTEDPNARHMRHKSWPLYADWCEIFGQSRAT